MKWLIFGASLALLGSWGVAQDAQDVPPTRNGIQTHESLKPGLVGKYWNVGKEMKTFPDEATCDIPNSCRIDGMINFDVMEGRGFGDLPLKKYFAAVWTGTLRMPVDGEYTCYLQSHEGSKLYLDGKLVVDHDGTHTLKETEGKKVDMKGGDHDLKIEYFQNKPGRLIFSWKYDGVEKQVVPSTALWHPFEKALDAN